MGHRVKSKNIAENLGSDCSCPIKRFGMEVSASPGRSGERCINLRYVLEVELRDFLKYWMSAVRERET